MSSCVFLLFLFLFCSCHSSSSLLSRRRPLATPRGSALGYALCLAICHLLARDTRLWIRQWLTSTQHYCLTPRCGGALITTPRHRAVGLCRSLDAKALDTPEQRLRAIQGTYQEGIYAVSDPASSLLSSTGPLLLPGIQRNKEYVVPSPLQHLATGPVRCVSTSLVFFERSRWDYCKLVLSLPSRTHVRGMLMGPRLHRALGTALEWPEAKKQADLVRKWGIRVSRSASANPPAQAAWP